MRKPVGSLVLALCLAVLGASRETCYGQVAVTNDPPSYGPYNASFLPAGNGLNKPLQPTDTVLRPDLPWSFYGWVNASEIPPGLTFIAGLGDPAEATPRYLALDNGNLVLWMGRDNVLATTAALTPNQWHFVAATFDGSSFHIDADGAEIGGGQLLRGTVSPVLVLAPAKQAALALTPAAMTALALAPAPAATPSLPPVNELSWQHFGGRIAGLTLVRRTLSEADLKQLAASMMDFSRVIFEEGSKPWPVQTKQQAGYRAPQDPATMPRSKASFSAPVALPVPAHKNALEPSGTLEWILAGGWKMIPAPELRADAAAISQPDFNDKQWWVATVPGTALTTMVDRGVYPDPDYGMNNLAIPESLNQQDYWYRNEFKAPKTGSDRLTLTFAGINYKAYIWLNGKPLGDVTGAFIRGVFDVSGVLKPGEDNVLVVRVSPPPHPGIPQEQSIRGGPGENGGMMCLDGPTFVATEGWDWIPAVRDRNTGIWQPVTLTAAGAVSIGDAQVVTSLPLPDTGRADVSITVPLINKSGKAVHGTLTASFDDIVVKRELTAPSGSSEVTLTPAQYPQLAVQHPRLWWPNGYGKPELHSLQLSFAAGGRISDSKPVRFGIREITYELSLLDGSGHLRHVEYSPTKARAEKAPVVNMKHDGMREIPAADPIPPEFPAEWRPFWVGWSATLTPSGETSPSVRPLPESGTASYLVIKVNGVRIAARGGNWGMDDSRKRVSRQRLEPYFRLNRDAHLNIIRNWVGQDTEETFYDLADEYGMLIWNDFWETTENYNAEPQDPAVFLENARDTILRFRNHPSIALWCGRNEGVPQPVINEGLDNLIHTLDGTRYYSPSSNQVNLQTSGPYSYQNPVHYYTSLNRGFSVETGTPSFSTLESFRAWIPKEDWWPIGDAWAYHDWHAAGNGDTKSFMNEIEREFGAPTGLEDFERKAQMLNYVNYRAIFEGMNAHLWAPNSGRLLWMTQPAWPSNMWQILTSDYDTQASFYGVKKACEPVHAQLDLSNYNVDVVNITNESIPGLALSANVYGLDNKLLLHREQQVEAKPDSTVPGFALELLPLVVETVAIVKLELRSASGELLSGNLYWIGGDSLAYRKLTRLPAVTLGATATSSHTNDTNRVRVQLTNPGSTVALMTKLTLIDAADDTRILPAYFSDNYVSLLPGETREVTVEYPASSASIHGEAAIAIRGWNVTAAKTAVAPQK